MENIWFDTWESIVRTVVLTTLGYCAMILLLRVSGKRTLSKMNAFDFIVTIALGSMMAGLALNKSISLADGVTAIALLIGFQFVITWLSVRTKAVKELVASSPSMLFYNGDFLHQAMKKERITVEEIYSASRKQGIAVLDEVAMIVLETTGDITIIKKMEKGQKVTVADVKTI